MKRLFSAIILSVLPVTVLSIEDDGCLGKPFGLGAYILNEYLVPTTPSSDFELVEAEANLVKHLPTNLVWQRCFLGQHWNPDLEICEGKAVLYTPQDALEIAEELGGGWRLPNINELRTVVERCRSYPALNTNVFADAAQRSFFDKFSYGILSSTPVRSNDGSVQWRRVALDTGVDLTEAGRGIVRLVREGD